MPLSSLDMLPGPVARQRRFSPSSRGENRVVPTAILFVASLIGAFVFSAHRLSRGSASLLSAESAPEQKHDLMPVVPGAPGVIRWAQHPVVRVIDPKADRSDVERPDTLTTVHGDHNSKTYHAPPAVHPETGKVVRAEIVTCPACRLNALPEVRRFVKTQADQFAPSLKVTYIYGEDPVMHIYSEDEEIEQFKLQDYSWKDIMRKLVKVGIYPNKLTPEVKEALPNLSSTR